MSAGKEAADDGLDREDVGEVELGGAGYEEDGVGGVLGMELFDTEGEVFFEGAKGEGFLRHNLLPSLPLPRRHLPNQILPRPRQHVTREIPLERRLRNRPQLLSRPMPLRIPLRHRRLIPRRALIMKLPRQLRNRPRIIDPFQTLPHTLMRNFQLLRHLMLKPQFPTGNLEAFGVDPLGLSEPT